VFVVIVPDVTLSTAKARQVLPREVSRDHAAFNLGRMALLLAGLADSRLLVPEATEDRLHQDYRSPLFPEAPKLLARLAAGGALATCWSGAGPSLVGISRSAQGAAVLAAAKAALAEADVPGTALLLRPDLHGLVVDRDGGTDLWRERPPTWDVDGTAGGIDGPAGGIDGPVPGAGSHAVGTGPR